MQATQSCKLSIFKFPLMFRLDECSSTTSMRNSDIFICGVNNGLESNVHYLSEEEEFATNGFSLNLNCKILQNKSIFIKNVDEYRQKAEVYSEVNDFSTCFPKHLISDQQTKTFVNNLLLKESYQKALVGYNYINHLKVFGFDDQQLERLSIEDHGEHENTVLLFDWQRDLVCYIRISPISTFKWNDVLKELRRCDEFLKSFLLLHEPKLKEHNLAVYCAMVFPDMSSTDIDNVFEMYDDLKTFIFCKDDIHNNMFRQQLNSVFEKIKAIRKDRGVKLEDPTSELRQILSESMTTMVLTKTTLPRISNNPFEQVVSLLLNREQYEVVHHPDNHIIITAGYGCGKTLVLIEIARTLFLKQEQCKVYFICSDPYSLLPARIRKFFQHLEKEFSNKTNVKLIAIGINESDSELGENKRDIVSVLEFYRKKENGNLVHFLIDEVDGEMFTEEYSERVKNFLTEDEMVQSSKVVFAMQSMAKQRSINSKGHYFKQTGMTLLQLEISMRMTENIYNLKLNATKYILQPTTINIKHQVDTEKRNQNSDQNLQEVDTTPKNVNNGLETDTPAALNLNLNLPRNQQNQEIEERLPAQGDTDIEMCKTNSPQLFANDSEIQSIEIKTHFTYPCTKNGVVKGKKPTIISLDSSFNLDLGECGAILVDILTQHLGKNFNTCILCNSQQELSLVKYSLEMLLKEHLGTFVYYTPSLDTRLPDDKEKDNVWDAMQKLSVLVTDHKGMRGCEAERVVAFVNQDYDYNNYKLVEIMTRAVADLCLLVLPCKSEDVKDQSLTNVIRQWMGNPEVLVKSYPSDFERQNTKTKYQNIDLNAQYEKFKTEKQNPSIAENVQR